MSDCYTKKERNAYQRRYRLMHHEKVRAIELTSYAKNIEQRRDYARTYREIHYKLPKGWF